MSSKETVNANVLPSPAVLLASSSPPMRSLSSREIASPSPLPPYRRVVETSACWKASKIVSSLCASMPMPLSETA